MILLVNVPPFYCTYPVVVLAPVLLVRPAKGGAVEAGRVAHLPHPLVTDFDPLLEWLLPLGLDAAAQPVDAVLTEPLVDDDLGPGDTAFTLMFQNASSQKERKVF